MGLVLTMITTIKKTRLTLNLSQPQMAQLMGMGRPRIVDIETGTTGRKETKVHISFLKALLVLNANGLIDELFDIEIEEYKAKVDKCWSPIETAPKEEIKIICASIRDGQGGSDMNNEKFVDISTTISLTNKKWLQDQKKKDLNINIIIDNAITIIKGKTTGKIKIYRDESAAIIYAKCDNCTYVLKPNNKWKPCSHTPAIGMFELPLSTWGQLYASFEKQVLAPILDDR